MATDFLKTDIDGVNFLEFISDEGNLFKYQVSKNLFGIFNIYGEIPTLFTPKKGDACWTEQVKKYKPREDK